MRVHHIAMRTASIEHLGAFYEDVLGFELIGGKPGYSRWYRMGAAVLMLEQRVESEVPLSSGNMEFLGFAVTVAERTHLTERLEAAGVSIEEESANTTYFRDPDGRRLGVSHFDFSALDSGDPPSA